MKIQSQKILKNKLNNIKNSNNKNIRKAIIPIILLVITECKKWK